MKGWAYMSREYIASIRRHLDLLEEHLTQVEEICPVLGAPVSTVEYQDIGFPDTQQLLYAAIQNRRMAMGVHDREGMIRLLADWLAMGLDLKECLAAHEEELALTPELLAVAEEITAKVTSTKYLRKRMDQLLKKFVDPKLAQEIRSTRVVHFLEVLEECLRRPLEVQDRVILNVMKELVT